MALQAYDLSATDWQRQPGAVIVNTVNGKPLPISVSWFADADDAEAWLQWCAARNEDPRRLPDLDASVMAWRDDTSKREQAAQSYDTTEAP